MSDQATAHCFFVEPSRPEATGEIETALRRFAHRKNTTREVRNSTEAFQVCEPSWRTAEGFESFTATVFKVRTRGLPSALGRNGPGPLPIDDETNLGECMCFSYSPADGVALVHYAHYGARHTVLQSFLREMGIEGSISVLPVIRKDMLDKFAQANVVGKIEYGLKLPIDPEGLKKSGGALGHMIDAATEIGGVSMHVTISIDAERRPGMIESVKRNVRALLDSTDAHVTTLKLNAAESEEKAFENLDLLHARLAVTVDVPPNGRYFGREHCQKFLHSKLREAIGEIRLQYPERFRFPPSASA